MNDPDGQECIWVLSSILNCLATYAAMTPLASLSLIYPTTSRQFWNPKHSSTTSTKHSKVLVRFSFSNCFKYMFLLHRFRCGEIPKAYQIDQHTAGSKFLLSNTFRFAVLIISSIDLQSTCPPGRYVSQKRLPTPHDTLWSSQPAGATAAR